MHDVDHALGALADPTRRRVVELLLEAPLRTNELADAIGVSVPAVSRHLRILRDRAIVDRVDVDGDGRGRQYKLNPESLASLADWLGATHWTDRLSNASNDTGVDEFLGRVGGFLDAFTTSDTAYFEQHLAPDVELIFPGSAQRWDKTATVASVAGHAPYVEWAISESSVRQLSPRLTIVTITVTVRTADATEAAPVIQTMVFDDTTTPWTLRFLQQSPTA